MEEHSLRSNRLLKGRYDEREQVLEIEFSNRDVKRYAGVPRTVWRSLIAAPNPASFFEDRIEEEYAGSAGTRRADTGAQQQLDDLFGDS